MTESFTIVTMLGINFFLALLYVQKNPQTLTALLLQ